MILRFFVLLQNNQKWNMFSKVILIIIRDDKMPDLLPKLFNCVSIYATYCYFVFGISMIIRLQNLSGWTVRLYHNLSRSDVASQKYLCRLYCQYPHLDLCQVDNLFPPKGQNADNSGHSNDSSATLKEVPKLPGAIGAIALARLKAAASSGVHG